MINLSEHADSAPKPTLESLVDQGIAEGVIGGIVAFMQHNRVKLHPTPNCAEPLKTFTGLFLSEYTTNLIDFPFDESFKGFVLKRIEEETAILQAVYQNNELTNLNKLCHVIGGEAAASFLESKREPALKLIRTLRED